MFTRLRLSLIVPRLALGLGAAMPLALSGCANIATGGALVLNFTPTDDARVDPARLLPEGRVPRERLVTIEQALERAPDGSLVLACWKSAGVANFWGPCSHIGRKLDSARLAESISPLEGGAGVYPLKRLLNRYAVVVIDAGVRAEHLPRLREEVARLNGRPYNLSNQPDTFYCSNYQNELQKRLGLREAVPWNPVWKMAVPADALLVPGAEVLWVGVNPGAPAR